LSSAFASTTSFNIVEWLPFWLAVGIASYFFLPFELPIIWSGGILLLLPFMWKLRQNYRAFWLLFILFLIGAGFALASWQALRLNAPALPSATWQGVLEGRVIDVQASDDKYRLLLDQIKLADLPAEQTPSHLRLTLQEAVPPPLQMRIRVPVKLYAPSDPVMPHAFDFARYFYFRQIGAMGYATAPADWLEKSQANWQDMFINARLWLQEQVLANMSGDAAAIASALLTGDQTGISKKTQTAFQRSGLTHMLSVSGAHMVIVSLLTYGWLRAMLALVPIFALRYNIKKIAAIWAIIATFMYLAISGFQLPAFRAWVMVFLFLLAILLGREANARRSLIWAAFILLVYQPSSLLEAGFQLSFAATLALLVYVHETAAIMRDRLYKPVYYVAEVLLASGVASLISEPLVMAHFHVFTPLGIFANILGHWVLAFWVMPCLLLVLPMLAVGAEKYVFWLAEKGINILEAIAYKVSSLEYASIAVPPMPDWAIASTGFGIAIILLAYSWRWRGVGVAMVGVALLSLLWVSSPDVIASADGKFIAIHEADGWKLAKGSSVRQFVVKQWSVMLGEKIRKTEVEGLVCQDILPTRQTHINIHRHAAEERYPCLTSGSKACGETWIPLFSGMTMGNLGEKTQNSDDNTMLGVEEAGFICTYKQAHIDSKELRSKGATAWWLRDGEVVKKESVCDVLGRRAWTRC